MRIKGRGVAIGGHKKIRPWLVALNMLAFVRNGTSATNSCDSTERKAWAQLGAPSMRFVLRGAIGLKQNLRNPPPPSSSPLQTGTQDVAGGCGLTLQHQKSISPKDVCGAGGGGCDEVLESCSATLWPLERRPESTPKLHANYFPDHLGGHV